MNQIIETILGFLKSPLNALDESLSQSLPDQSYAALAAFAFYCLVVLAGGLTAVLSRNLVRAMMGLILTFLGVAGFYLLLACPFLAFMQLLIYVGAVCVLVFFAVMLTKNSAVGQEQNLPSLSHIILGFLAGLAPLAILTPMIIKHAPNYQITPEPTKTSLLGRGLLSSDVVPFELISIILLVAMAGAVFLVWRKKPDKKPN
ncbi:MAG: NADH-quinone oxidoreductase subunit J [Deltaproteobacteria bacterium]|jgi:NADH-quinone oxidoreductase subunit J|nr:NADH-quinone oxidoreductase subunit J [Deltaproteobacteria bacterium]